jgi:ribosomal protein L37E
MPEECEMCGNDGVGVLGVMGKTVHKQCRYCGWEASEDVDTFCEFMGITPDELNEGLYA